MKWEVNGADRATGEEKSIILDADNEDSARRRGNRAGLMVADVRALDEGDSVAGVPVVRTAPPLPVARAAQVVAPQGSPIFVTPQTYTQVNVLPRTGRTANILGIISVVFAAIALTICWVPFFGLLSMPMAGIALLLAIIGLIVAACSNVGFGSPIAGGIMAAIALFIQVTMTATAATVVAQAAQAAQQQQAARVQNQRASRQAATSAAQSAPIDNDEWAGVGAAASQNFVTVKLDSAAVAPIQIKDLRGEVGRSEGEHLAIALTITNTGTTKKLDYATWRGAMFETGRTAATLTDELGNSYRRIRFSETGQIVGASKNHDSVYPGQSIKDVLIFEAPVAAAKELRLELPGANVGGEDSIRLKLTGWKTK